MTDGKLNSPKPVTGDVQNNVEKAMRSDPEDSFYKKGWDAKSVLDFSKAFSWHVA